MEISSLLDVKGIVDQVNTGRPVEIVFPVMNSTIQDAIHFIVDEILKKYNKTDIKESVYTTLKELVINGIKANIKHTIFMENGIDPNNEESLNKGLALLKNIMHEKNIQELQAKAVEKKLRVKVSILHSAERLIIVVENNTAMTELENKRIKEKFEAALKYDSIADYYLNNIDDSEGEGIGITMIVLMLKGNNIDPHAFTIDRENKGATQAKIEFPIRPKTETKVPAPAVKPPVPASKIPAKKPSVRKSAVKKTARKAAVKSKTAKLKKGKKAVKKTVRSKGKKKRS
jgi:hypothetical protein